MFLTKLKLGTAAVLCACLIGGSFTSLGIAQDAKPKPAVGGRLDLDGDAFPDILVNGQLSLVNQKSKSQPKSKVRTVDLGRILDLLDRDTDLDGDACPDILLDLGGGTQILITNYRSHLRGGKPGKELKDVNPKGGNPGDGAPNNPRSRTDGDNKPAPNILLPGAEGPNKQPQSGTTGSPNNPQPGTGDDPKVRPNSAKEGSTNNPQPGTDGDKKPGPNSAKVGTSDNPLPGAEGGVPPSTQPNKSKRDNPIIDAEKKNKPDNPLPGETEEKKAATWPIELEKKKSVLYLIELEKKKSEPFPNETPKEDGRKKPAAKYDFTNLQRLATALENFNYPENTATAITVWCQGGGKGNSVQVTDAKTLDVAVACHSIVDGHHDKEGLDLENVAVMSADGRTIRFVNIKEKFAANRPFGLLVNRGELIIVLQLRKE
jgi:hypothetical protein